MVKIATMVSLAYILTWIVTPSAFAHLRLRGNPWKHEGLTFGIAWSTVTLIGCGYIIHAICSSGWVLTLLGFCPLLFGTLRGVEAFLLSF
jgi:hypothetical protein